MNNLAVALEQMGRFDEALEVLNRAAALSPALSHVENNLAKRLTAAGRERLERVASVNFRELGHLRLLNEGLSQANEERGAAR